MRSEEELIAILKSHEKDDMNDYSHVHDLIAIPVVYLRALLAWVIN